MSMIDAVKLISGITLLIAVPLSIVILISAIFPDCRMSEIDETIIASAIVIVVPLVFAKLLGMKK